MTLLPVESRNLVGVEGEKYTLNDACACPDCNQIASERHHIVRRSELKGDYWWFAIPLEGSSDGSPSFAATVYGDPIPNCVGLCSTHHRFLTGDIGGHRAQILLNGDVFHWLDLREPDVPQPLSPQPGPQRAAQLTVDGGEVPHDEVCAAREGEKPCPRCKGKGRVPKPAEKPADAEPAPERKKATWSVRVPKDEKENGYEVLASLVEQATERCVDLGLVRDVNAGAHYYCLTAVLHDWLTT